MMSVVDQGELSSRTFVITRKSLSDILFASSYKNMDKKFEDLLQFLAKKTYSSDNNSLAELKISLRNFKQQFLSKWHHRYRNKSKFIEYEKLWLNGTCSFKVNPVPKETAGGRTAKGFEECSEQTKRRKTADLRVAHCAEELAYAAQMKLRAEGKRLEAKNVRKIIGPVDCASPKDGNTEKSTLPKLSTNQALSLIIEAQLSKKQYNIIRSYAKDIFPSYDLVKKEKMLCIPEGKLCTDVEAEVPLQSLLDHTATRLLQVQEEVLLPLIHENKYTLHVKWGFDGSSSHTQYMQRFASDESDDKYMLLTSIVPIRLTTETFANDSLVVWQNPRCSSPRFCRPLKLQYQKETAETSKKLMADVDSQIKSVCDTKIVLHDREYIISYKLVLTMIDGKVCNSLSDTKSTMKCYLCEATPKEFNNLDLIATKPINKKYLSFGLSVLHSWIRLFECLLHLAYKLPVKSWRVHKNDKALVENNKKKIQTAFKDKLSLIIDKPKPGYGNSNDGNVARKFFQNHEISAMITGIDKELIRRFYIILQTISSGFKINDTKFKDYCTVTAKLYVSLYPWCPMTTTVHKILIHGSEIISEFLLPIGCLSEEAQEAKNKDFKAYRERFSRKCSRKDNMSDVFDRLLIASDPVITYMRPLPILDRKAFDPEAINMFSEDISVLK